MRPGMKLNQSGPHRSPSPDCPACGAIRQWKEGPLIHCVLARALSRAALSPGEESEAE